MRHSFPQFADLVAQIGHFTAQASYFAAQPALTSQNQAGQRGADTNDCNEFRCNG